MNSALDTDQLTRILSSVPGLNFNGVYAYDELPSKQIGGPVCVVINSDKATEKGQHWSSVFINTHQEGQYFCSYGLKPYGRIFDFLKKKQCGVFL